MLFWSRLIVYTVVSLLVGCPAAADGCTDTATLAMYMMNERQFNPENEEAAKEDLGVALGMASATREGMILNKVFRAVWDSPRVPPNDRAGFIETFGATITEQCYAEGWDNE